jgi:antitoxin (DNA-binding transcriptional repressor) of toxin-antitoxin stability system
MTLVGSYQAKTRLPELLERVEHGEKIVITRRGIPVALLTQPPPVMTRDVRQVVEEMLAYRDRQKRTIGKLTIREMIDEGRRYQL